MSKYRWDFKELNEYYKNLYKKNKNYKVLEQYKELLYINNPDKYSCDPNLLLDIFTYDNTSNNSKKIIIDDNEYFNNAALSLIPFYNGNNPKYIDLLSGCYEYLNYENNLDNNYSIALTDDDIIDITLAFYKKMFPTNIYNEVKEIVNKDKHILNIRYIKNRTDYENTTYFDKKNKTKRILITRHNDMQDLFTLSHELMHYILNDYDYGKNKNSSIYLNEVEGYLASLLFSEYYQKYNNTIFDNKNNDDDSNYFKIYHLDELGVFSRIFITKNELLLALNDKNKVDEKKFKKEMDEYKISDYEIEEYLEYDNKKALTYGLGILIAMDLYNKALTDPELAINTLKNIKDYKNQKNLITHLRNNNITFMDDDYSNLRKYIKSMTN